MRIKKAMKFGGNTEFKNYSELQNYLFFNGTYLFINDFIFPKKEYKVEYELKGLSIEDSHMQTMYKFKYVALEGCPEEEILNIEMPFCVDFPDEIIFKNGDGERLDIDEEWKKLWNNEWNEEAALKKYKEIIEKNGLTDEIYLSELDKY